ncbi:MAG: Xaa-Pro peptidase family protein [Deltaproteobacteria bacterium]
MKKSRTSEEYDRSFPKEEIHARIGRLQDLMRHHGFGGALIVQRADLFYFSGTGQDAHLFVPDEGEPRLMVRKSYERACMESPLEHISLVTGLSSVADQIRSHDWDHSLSLGMELDVVPANNYLRYKQLFIEHSINDISPLIRNVRMVKSPLELEKIRAAAKMTDRMFGVVREMLTEGMTELQLAGRLEAYYRERGHQGYTRVRSFNQEVFYGHLMSGPNLTLNGSSLGPHSGSGTNPSYPQGPGHRVIGNREPVLVDYGCGCDGYLVDQARVFALRGIDEKFLDAHEVARRIQHALIAQGLPGVEADALYHTACNLAAESGLGDRFMGYPTPVSFVGHGIGIEVDELPVIGLGSAHTLEAGMVLALEPKFFFPGEGLAGLENTFVVTERGLERLTFFDDAIQIL